MTKLTTASHIPLMFILSDGKNTYDTFQKCFDDKLKTLFAKGGYGNAEQLSQAITFFGKIETEMDCSGACHKPIFGIGRSISKGPVTRECLEVILDSLDDLMAPGVVCLLTFFVLMCAVCGAIPICTGFDKEEEEMGE